MVFVYSNKNTLFVNESVPMYFLLIKIYKSDLESDNPYESHCDGVNGQVEWLRTISITPLDCWITPVDINTPTRVTVRRILYVPHTIYLNTKLRDQSVV